MVRCYLSVYFFQIHRNQTHSLNRNEKATDLHFGGCAGTIEFNPHLRDRFLNNP